MINLLFQELTSGQLMIHPSALAGLELLAHKIMNGEKPDHPDKSKAILSSLCHTHRIASVFPDDGYDMPDNPFDQFEEDSVAVIPIVGPMFKYGSWWNYGMDDMSNLIRLADQSTKIIGTIILANTPGGSSQSTIQLEDALRNRTKPSICLVDGNLMSGGMYVGVFCNLILATNPMCQVGNIGVYAQMMDDSKMYEDYGIKFISVYPPESKYKNLAVKEALAGNDKMLIDENLSPYAQHFQNIVKTNRPNLDLSVEGIIEGKDFYAQDAVKYGLIDGIANFEGAVARLRSIAAEQKTIYSPFNFNSK